jgi:hypothetical protein
MSGDNIANTNNSNPQHTEIDRQERWRRLDNQDSDAVPLENGAGVSTLFINADVGLRMSKKHTPSSEPMGRSGPDPDVDVVTTRPDNSSPSIPIAKVSLS